MKRKIRITTNAMLKNDEIAEANRQILRNRKLKVINLISSPGAGKTALLEAMGEHYGKRLGVITGDIQMQFDADRINASGAAGVQIETGGTCHLTAHMVQKGLEQLNLETLDLLVIENVGNLVCPSTYDLGEDFKVALVSVTEGDEKPAKYPALFLRAQMVLLTKTDLLPYVDFSVERIVRDCKSLNPDIEVLSISARSGEGMDRWLEWLENR